MTFETELLGRRKCFGGVIEFHRHASRCCGADMRFAVFVPPAAGNGPVPALYYLAGLTCNEETFMVKAGAQAHAASHSLLLVAPDTSPRGAGLAGEDDDWDLGTGAGFYVDATREPWSAHYRMYSYVTEELPALIAAKFPVIEERQGIFGHSMGGHGALVCALRNPDLFKSVSAFAPICAPMRCPWGRKAFRAYLGADEETWRRYDASEVVRRARPRDSILIDQGTADEFLATQLHPDRFRAVCEEVKQPLELRLQADYDHSYYFVSTFMGAHIAHHAAILHGQPAVPRPVFG